MHCLQLSLLFIFLPRRLENSSSLLSIWISGCSSPQLSTGETFFGSERPCTQVWSDFLIAKWQRKMSPKLWETTLPPHTPKAMIECAHFIFPNARLKGEGILIDIFQFLVTDIFLDGTVLRESDSVGTAIGRLRALNSEYVYQLNEGIGSVVCIIQDATRSGSNFYAGERIEVLAVGSCGEGLHRPKIDRGDNMWLRCDHVTTCFFINKLKIGMKQV